jgi:hypothetical protein
MIKGALKADGLAVMEILQASFLAGSANPKMRARIAFVKSDTGATLGYTEHENWSKETLQALAILRASMENDVAQLYLEGYGPTRSGGAAAAPQGIADHLGDNDVPPA